MVRQKVVAIIAIICIAIFSFTLIASADVTHYASIPRPVNSDSVKYVIADNPSQNYCTIYRISRNILDVDSVFLFFASDNNSVKLMAYNTDSISLTVFIDRFNLDGQLITSYQISIPSGGLPNAVTLLNFSSNYVGYLDIGDIPLQEGSDTSSFGIPSVAWADATDPQVYLTQIEEIQRRLALLNIDAGASATYLLSIETELSLIKELFSSNSAVIKTQTDKIDDSLNELNEDLNEDMSELNQGVEELITQGQAEYNSAVSGAADSLNVITGIENKGEGIISAMGSLISALSYNGTECNWKLPEVYIPAIPNVIDRTLLFKDSEIDFEFWINKIPDNIMTVIKALSTLALIVYCFKELYGTLSYVFTLKKE